jgi:hypothetical protein
MMNVSYLKNEKLNTSAQFVVDITIKPDESLDFQLEMTNILTGVFVFVFVIGVFHMRHRLVEIVLCRRRKRKVERPPKLKTTPGEIFQHHRFYTTESTARDAEYEMNHL